MYEEVVKVIKLAVREKEREITYYRKAAEECKNPNGKKIFEYLAEQEGSHLTVLKEHLSSAENKGAWLSDERAFNKKACTLKRKKPKSVVPSRAKADASDLEALRQAIEIEKNAINFYTEAACKTNDRKAVKVLHYLIEAEKTHLKELELQYAFLKSEGFWYDNEVTPT